MGFFCDCMFEGGESDAEENCFVTFAQKKSNKKCFIETIDNSEILCYTVDGEEAQKMEVRSCRS